MTQDLFRKEALEATRASWLGGISLSQPVRLWILTVCAVIAAIAVALLVTFGTYTRRTTVPGQLAPSKGLATILAPATGILSRLDVAEGDRVEAGQVLAIVTVPRSTEGAGDTVAALRYQIQQQQMGLESAQAARREQFSAQANGLAAQLATAKRELAEGDAEIATRKDQVRIANEMLDRLRQLEDQKFVSIIDLKQRESAALEQVSAMQSLRRQGASLRRTIQQLEQARLELPGQRQTTEANLARELATLEQEQVETASRGALVVAAPVSGVVVTQTIKPGQAIQAGQSLLSLLPGDGELEAELLVPSRGIGFVEPGDKVMLRYQAYPYQKFGHHEGRVMRISRSALAPEELRSMRGDLQPREPLYRVTVALARQAVTAYGKPEALKPGMLLDADILGERRTLIEWVLEPLYSIKGF